MKWRSRRADRPSADAAGRVSWEKNALFLKPGSRSCGENETRSKGECPRGAGTILGRGEGAMIRVLRHLQVAAVALALASPAPASSAESSDPQLVVIVVVDQFRADYVDSYGSRWTKGLRRLFREGAYFTEAAYPYSHTVTCGRARHDWHRNPAPHPRHGPQWMVGSGHEADRNLHQGRRGAAHLLRPSRLRG